MASRLDLVLRAGAARNKNRAEDESGLTRALKKTSLVPTGACLPRNFDPEYCAYDRYYAIGVALVSATVTVLLECELPQRLVSSLAKNLRDTVGYYCHTENPTAFNSDAWDEKSDVPGYFTESAKTNARKEFSALCKAMDYSLVSAQILGGALSHPDWHTHFQSDSASEMPYNMLVKALTRLLVISLAPVFGLGDPAHNNGYPPIVYVAHPLGVTATLTWAAATVKYLSRYMNEHAMMIASFFRVNAKRLRASEPLMLDLQAFARQCREDIADGPGPAVPPPPPPPPPPPAPEDRDPLMDGVDYPPSIGASAGAAMPFRK